jgi:hypothetical protein
VELFDSNPQYFTESNCDLWSLHRQLMIIPGGGHDNHLTPEYQEQLKQFCDRVL